MLSGRSVVFVSLTVLFLSFFMCTPLPTGVERPWKLRFTTLLVDTTTSVCNLVEKLTGTPFAETFFKMTVLFSKPVHQNYPQIKVEEKNLDGIPARVYRPLSLPDGLSPCVVYFHGGGFVTLDIDVYDQVLVDMALQTNMVVIAVRYRYAPKHPFPIPFDDCVKATAFLLRDGDTLGVDGKRLAVMGDSAGGNLAAAVSLRLSQEDPSVMPPIKLQVLVCPLLQAMTFDTNSYRDNGNWYLKRGLMVFFWAAYLGLDLNTTTYNIMYKDAHVSTGVQRSPLYNSYIKNIRAKPRGPIKVEYDKPTAALVDHLVTDPFLAPLMADDQDLARVAPAYVLASEFDILRDDAMRYAERLQKAGVDTDMWLLKGQPHVAVFMKAWSWMVDNSDTDEIFSQVSKYIVDKLTV